MVRTARPALTWNTVTPCHRLTLHIILRAAARQGATLGPVSTCSILATAKRYVIERSTSPLGREGWLRVRPDGSREGPEIEPTYLEPMKIGRAHV